VTAPFNAVRLQQVKHIHHYSTAITFIHNQSIDMEKSRFTVTLIGLMFVAPCDDDELLK